MTHYKLAPDVIWVPCLEHVVCLTTSGLQATLKPEIATYWMALAEADDWVAVEKILQSTNAKATDSQIREVLTELASAGLLDVKLE